MTSPSPGGSTAKGGETHRIGPGPLKYRLVRSWIALTVHAYLRVRYTGVDRIPDEPYVLCINHPSWLDPAVFEGTWPDRRRRLFIFGPVEKDMSRGWRNRFITWTGIGVPLKPGGADVVDTTRRAVAVLRGGDLLLVAGEGRLSDLEGQARPLEPGVAHFAALARVTILPAAIIGTRWVHFGTRVEIRIGRPVRQTPATRGRAGIEAVTVELQAQFRELLAGVEESSPPSGRFGRWFSEAFNERPWLAEGTPATTASEPDAAADPKAEAEDLEALPDEGPA